MSINYAIFIFVSYSNVYAFSLYIHLHEYICIFRYSVVWLWFCLFIDVELLCLQFFCILVLFASCQLLVIKILVYLCIYLDIYDCVLIVIYRLVKALELIPDTLLQTKQAVHFSKKNIAMHAFKVEAYAFQGMECRVYENRTSDEGFTADSLVCHAIGQTKNIGLDSRKGTKNNMVSISLSVRFHYFIMIRS